MDEREDRRHPIEEDMRFQRRSWAVERAGWIGIGVLVCLALTGLFGQGLWSKATASAGDNTLAVEYERFQRITRLARFEFRLAPTESQDTTLRLSRPFQRSYEVTQIQPRPLRSSAGPETSEFVFARPGSGDLVAIIWAYPRRSGIVDLQASGERGGPLAFRIIVYP
jgi:hypothetical protein